MWIWLLPARKFTKSSIAKWTNYNICWLSFSSFELSEEDNRKLIDGLQEKVGKLEDRLLSSRCLIERYLSIVI